MQDVMVTYWERHCRQGRTKKEVLDTLKNREGIMIEKVEKVASTGRKLK